MTDTLDSAEPAPLLSSEETAALLGAMQAGRASLAPKLASVDLTAREGGLYTLLGVARRSAAELGSEVRRVLRRVADVPVTVREPVVELATWDVASGSIASGAAIAEISVREGQCVLVVGPQLAAAAIERRLGAPEGVVPSARVELSTLDRRVVRVLLEALLRSFAVALGNVPMTLAQVHPRPTDLPTLAGAAPVMRITVTVSLADGGSDTIVLVVPGDATRGLTPEPPKPPPGTPTPRTQLAARIENAEVEVAAILGAAQSTVRAVLALAVGDVVRLDRAPDEAVEVHVAGVRKLRGQPVVHRGNLAVEVTEVTPRSAS